ncbi:MAG: NlpC/P60 family protein, partial [Ilumatobacteraceae bacterium]
TSGSTGGGSADTGSSGGGGGDTGGGSAPAVSGKAGTAVAAAYSQLGVPYKFAAESPGEAFDCSGLTKWAWGRAGVGMPHQSGAQYGSFPHVSQSEAQPGDLIFYYSPIGHVGIYIGGGQMIHAPQTGDVVKVSTVHWNKVVGVARPG